MQAQVRFKKNKDEQIDNTHLIYVTCLNLLFSLQRWYLKQPHKPQKEKLHHCLKTIHTTIPPSKPLYVCHYLGFRQSELCPWRKEGGALTLQTGLWLPLSKFPVRPFCMSKLESTPSIRRLFIMLRHLFVFVSYSWCTQGAPHTDMSWTHIKLRGIFWEQSGGFLKKFGI